MSLRETIEGARREASEAGSVLRRSPKDDEATEAAAETEAAAAAKNQGFSRRSSARAKPSREAAGSVRPKRESEKTKEEKKQDRQTRRNKEDLKFDARDALLNSNETYKKAHRTWLIMMGAGAAILLVCFFISRFVMSQAADTNLMLMVMSIFVVLSYVLIIVSIIYDYRKIRPIRKEIDAQVDGMTDKRMKRVISDYEKQKAAEKAAKGK